MGCSRGRRVEESDRVVVVELVSKAVIEGCRLKVACNDLEIDFKTYCRWKDNTLDRRNGPISAPANKLSAEVRNEIVSIANSSEFKDDSPWVIVAKLADKETYIASESSFYKVLKEKNLLTHRGKSKARTHNRPSPLIATAPNQIWSWDITYCMSDVRGIYWYLYLFMDIFSRKIVGFDIFQEESMQNSSRIFDTICSNENIKKNQLTLHSDNGGPMKGATMLATLQRLGVMPSFSRPRVSDDNPYSESLFKTVKYHHTYPGQFKTLDEAKKWVIGFVNWYNCDHLHSGIKFVTPEQRHLGVDKEILEKREDVYLKAKKNHPQRWGSRAVKNFKYIKEVNLNHLQQEISDDIKKVS